MLPRNVLPMAHRRCRRQAGSGGSSAAECWVPAAVDAVRVRITFDKGQAGDTIRGACPVLGR